MSDETKSALTTVEVEKHVTELCRDMAHIIEVQDDETYSLAGEYLVDTKRWLREIDSVFDAPIQAAHEAHKAMLRAKKTVSGRLLDDEQRLKRMLADYSERKLAVQQASEVKAQLAALDDATSRQEQQAVQLVAQGRDLEAEQVLALPPVVPTVVLDKAPPRVHGVTMTTVWEFEVDDPNAVPREYLCVDEQKIRGVVRALKENAKIPGVKVFSRRAVSARGA